MDNGHKDKKPTKAQMINEIIPQQFEDELKKSHIKGLVQGFEIANQMLLEYAESYTIEELIEFCKKNVENKAMERVVSANRAIEELDEAIEKLRVVGKE